MKSFRRFVQIKRSEMARKRGSTQTAQKEKVENGKNRNMTKSYSKCWYFSVMLTLCSESCASSSWPGDRLLNINYTWFYIYPNRGPCDKARLPRQKAVMLVTTTDRQRDHSHHFTMHAKSHFSYENPLTQTGIISQVPRLSCMSFQICKKN